MKKLCTKKCKKCKGIKCPNYLGYIKNKDAYYEGILHSKNVKNVKNVKEATKHIDSFDFNFIYLFILIFVILLIFGSLLP